MLPRTSSFSVYNNLAEVQHLIKVAKNMGYKYMVQVDKKTNFTTVTWIRRARR